MEEEAEARGRRPWLVEGVARDVEGRVCKGVGASLRPEAEGLREKSHLANDAVKNANTARTPGQGTVLPLLSLSA